MSAADWTKPGDDARDIGAIACPVGCGKTAAVRRAKNGKLHVWCRGCGTTLNGSKAAQDRLLREGEFFGSPPAPSSDPAAKPSRSEPAPRSFFDAFADDD